MEEQGSWKGHTFTLMIFGGIVVLCSIFFVLGMIVGRTQSVKLGSVAAAEAATKAAPKEVVRDEPPPSVIPQSTEKARQPVFEAPAAKADPPPPAPKAAPKVEQPAPPANVANLQIAALKKQNDAEKQVSDLKKKGFRAFMMAPTPNDANPFYRVQVGPFSDPIELESAKQKLEAAGYKPIVKK